MAGKNYAALYEWLKADPLVSCRFSVSIEEDGKKDEIVAAFSQFSGIQMRMETIQARAGSDPRGVQTHIPVMTSFEPVTLSRGVVADNPFMDWVFETAAGSFDSPGGQGLYRTLVVRALNDTGTGGVLWRMKNALPIGYSVGGMDSVNSGILIESLTLSIGGVERERFHTIFPMR